MPEEWRPVVGWEGLYEVSSLGRVRSLYTNRIRPSEGRGRYPGLSLFRNGRGTYRTVHSLMAEAFLPNPDNLPVVRHLNDDPRDNRLENLAWGTHSDNRLDSVRNGGYRNGNTDKRHCKRGHPLSGDNLRITSSGRRECRTCSDKARKEFRERSRESGLEGGDPRHGTPYGYSVFGCRCEECSSSWRCHSKRQLEARARKGIPEGDPRHGTYYGYKGFNCRCEPCRKANREYERERSERVKSQTKPPQ